MNKDSKQIMENPMRYKVAFVIPVHNRLTHTQHCLQMLEEQKGSLFFKNNEVQIVIADDGSDDGTSEWINKHYPDVIVLHGDGNLWYSGGLNLGINHALDQLGSDFIMVWLNDNYPDEGYFDHLQDILEKWDGKTLICSKIHYRSRPELIYGMGATFNRRTGRKVLIGWREQDGPEYQKDTEVDCFSGQGVLIHKDIIEKVGLFDEVNFPQYHADIDYSLRAIDKGYRNVVYHNLRLLNDTETTGINRKRDKSLKEFFESFTSTRSALNLRRNIKFYKTHTTSFIAYGALVRKYYIYTGSFVKWKVLKLFGIGKNGEDGS